MCPFEKHFYFSGGMAGAAGRAWSGNALIFTRPNLSCRSILQNYESILDENNRLVQIAGESFYVCDCFACAAEDSR